MKENAQKLDQTYELSNLKVLYKRELQKLEKVSGVRIPHFPLNSKTRP